MRSIFTGARPRNSETVPSIVVAATVVATNWRREIRFMANLFMIKRNQPDTNARDNRGERLAVAPLSRV